ncbi:hypothetical protein BCR33DRAFT_359345 [Rhizoclosmatium globosum]|uniref:Uncharacterized protein n=1 Tax=Rhizoclosmatium globosum TaxID=329046 RepID=A0A1Y2C1I9_9FUNG|nr:hypothetical protein BCR33DRAFT_359345 [Rhizoclosmatium globosum]|eukprot:ORY40826.1 hypothetical protein BCR33DRAFT_359345 [Rhizoclosmatium globosum]
MSPRQSQSKGSSKNAKTSKERLYLTPSTTTPNRIALTPCPPSIPKVTAIQESVESLLTVFSSTRVHRDRLIYALAGCLFCPQSPPPFGGSKTKPGYISFDGESAYELLHYIVAESLGIQWKLKQTKAVKLVGASVNRVLGLHYAGIKDEVDELMLKGMKKAGHSEWFGVVRVPEHLVHVSEEGCVGPFVAFVMPSTTVEKKELQTSVIARGLLGRECAIGAIGSVRKVEVDHSKLSQVSSSGNTSLFL